MMIRLFRPAATTFVVLAASISIPACGMEEDLDPSRESECSPIDEDAKDYDLLAGIEEMGLCASTAIDLGDEYLVEGDISVPKARLRDKQRRAATLVSIDNVEWITVRADAALPATWRTATQEAITEWNNATATALHFQFTNGAVADIAVVEGGSALPGDPIAIGTFPFNGLAGELIRINTALGQPLPNYRRAVVMHTLGNSIGLDATDVGAGVVIPGTPTTDAASVMNIDLGPWAGLSAGDIAAVRILYPFRVSSFTAEFTGCSFGVPRYVMNWGPAESGVLDWQVQRHSGGTYVNHYQGPNMGMSFNGSSNVSYTFRVRANTILGPTAWKIKGFQAPDCSGPNPL